jgi:hypothetical protein
VPNHYIASLHKYVLHLTSSGLHDIVYTYFNIAFNDISIKLMNPASYQGNKTKLLPDGLNLNSHLDRLAANRKIVIQNHKYKIKAVYKILTQLEINKYIIINVNTRLHSDNNMFSQM